jgi:hypothetical protein
MRTAVAILVSVATLVGMVSLLMREDTPLWQLVVLGGAAGMLVGRVRWGQRGALVGAMVGCVLGLLAPFLYAPFWLAFTLPPHPEHDL